jgi:hypothetical protein
LIVGRILAHIDYLDEAIDELSGAIEEQLRWLSLAQGSRRPACRA